MLFCIQVTGMRKDSKAGEAKLICFMQTSASIYSDHSIHVLTNSEQGNSLFILVCH